jgi:hypothetical protein
MARIRCRWQRAGPVSMRVLQMSSAGETFGPEVVWKTIATHCSIGRDRRTEGVPSQGARVFPTEEDKFDARLGSME